LRCTWNCVRRSYGVTSDTCPGSSTAVYRAWRCWRAWLS
jgi:hypothetical protein